MTSAISKQEKREVELSQLFAPFSPPETNFMERLRYWAVALPDKIAYRFLERGEVDESTKTLTNAQLDEHVRAIAAKLIAAGFSGKRALLMYPPGLDFVISFFACHFAGVIPVPAYPPRRNRNMSRINAIAVDAKASVVLTDRSIIKRWREQVKNDSVLGDIPWIATEIIPLDLANDWVQPQIAPHDLGLIQYTSGSTGTPKGVMLTHDNLISNCRMITRAFQIDSRGSGCSWLPLYHDMGLIGGILNPLYCGIPETLMSPVAFLTQPIRWLEAISKFKATASGGPNFAYAWCTMKISPDQCKDLDLSSWEVAFNGAEPVRADVLDQFAEKFEPYGFNRRSFYPCYGMAETTLIVTGGSKFEPPVIRRYNKNDLVEHRVVRTLEDDKAGRRLVGCGRVLEEEEVLIVNPETCHPLPDDQIGEIWINSPSCGVGYWQKPDETEKTFRARLNPDNGKFYVRSGDLGFMDRGELFVAGRLKDMIIVRGVNRYPQDIEATVEHCHPLTRSGGCAAFAVTRWDREHLVIVCEVERSPDREVYDEVIAAIRAAVTDEHELPPDAIVLVRAYSIPKTSSGKVQRHACKRNFETGEDLVELARWCSWEVTVEKNQKADATEEVPQPSLRRTNGLAQQVVDAVIQQVKLVGQDRAKQVDLETNIVHLGLDSLERLDIAQSLQTLFGGHLPEEVLQEVETVRDVAEAIQKYIGTQPVNQRGDHELDSQDSRKPNGRMSGKIPESYYQLEKMPEFLRLNELKKQVFDTGVRNPFFSVHEGRISDTTQIDGKTLISFASYNYLGLSGHPDVNQNAKQAIDQFGTSVSASRIVSGEKTIHKQLEYELADFLNVEDVITFPGGHATNESVIGHLVGPGDLIIHDSFAHNSIIQGALLSGAKRRPFEHNNWQELNRILRESRADYRRVLIAIEGLYSMDGDYPDLPRFVQIKKRYKAWLYVDEAHSIGTLGETGRGIAEVYGVPRQDVECWMGTLSKAFGSCGGFVGGSSALIEYLRYTTPGYVFAAGMPPANVGAALGALRVLKQQPQLVQKLHHNSQLFLRLAKEAGLNTGMASGTPITPIITGASILALKLSEALFDANINAQPILYPAVPEKETRVRIFMTAAHSDEQIRYAVETLRDCWKRISEDQISKRD